MVYICTNSIHMHSLKNNGNKWKQRQIAQQQIADDQFKADLEDLANSNPDMIVGTKSQTELVYEELDNLRADLKIAEEAEDYAYASALLIKIEKYKKKYKL